MRRKTATLSGHSGDGEVTDLAKLISVIAVDDRPLMMSGIDSALGREADIKLVAKITTVEASLAAIEKFRPESSC
jgi:hypothetical protein